MATIVVKFGGTSVADVEKIENAAGKVMREVERGNNVVVVVSAMSGVTNQLVGYCTEISPMHDAREYDAVVSSGEQVTAGLMAMALQKCGVEARSWLGWQVPIRTDDTHGKARILEIETTEIRKRLDKGEVVVVPGFQGVTEQGRISTLGRGGSDTSAVALAAALEADRCDIYTDVDGVYTTDPRIVPKAKKLAKVSYEEMIEMASLGAKVLQTRSVEIAMKHQPFGCELIDRHILECTKANLEHAKNRFFVEGDPGAVLVVEIRHDDPEHVASEMAAIEAEMRAAGLGYAYPVLHGADCDKIWELRRAGQGLMNNVEGPAKPRENVEDTAVAVEDLPDYIEEFDALMRDKYQISCVYYAHAGAG